MRDLSDIDLVEALAKPFAEGSSVGEDLRGDALPQSLYYSLRDARAEARAAERQADNDPELGSAMPPQWASVTALAAEALETRTKDVEIASWLVEGLTRQRGLGGFSDGVDLLGALIGTFWTEGLLPQAEEDDPEGRLAAITGLSGQDRDGSLLQPLRKTVLFGRADGTAVTLWDYERSARLAVQGGKSDGKAAAGVIPFPDLEGEARGPGREALRTLARLVTRAEASWTALEAVIAARVAPEAQPSTGRVRALLATLRQVAASYLPAEDLAAPDAEPLAVAPEPAAKAATNPQLADRETLLDEILRIAGLFRRAEPNSPLSFTLEEAVRRARMPWPDLLRELVADGAARAAMMTLAGLRADAKPTES